MKFILYTITVRASYEENHKTLGAESTPQLASGTTAGVRTKARFGGPSPAQFCSQLREQEIKALLGGK